VTVIDLNAFRAAKPISEPPAKRGLARVLNNIRQRVPVSEEASRAKHEGLLKQWQATVQDDLGNKAEIELLEAALLRARAGNGA